MPLNSLPLKYLLKLVPILTCLFGNDDSGWATFCYWETKCHFCFNCNNLQTSQITWAFQRGTVYFCTSRGYKVIDQKRVIDPTRIWTQTCRRQRISLCKMLLERSHHSRKVKYKLVQTLIENPPLKYPPLKYQSLKYPPLKYLPLKYPPLKYPPLKYPPLKYQLLRYCKCIQNTSSKLQILCKYTSISTTRNSYIILLICTIIQVVHILATITSFNKITSFGIVYGKQGLLYG